ncbi:MAG: electron transport complex subunit RsxC [Gammaproteobacteria bacterium]|nr:electron transport complex subunit RsxC [Gammaproteobacteria bacterium]MCP4091063.1 electron transport complex subunit RsxC [Gammaproteobacteria bacterium]MCP4277411.1 electron transport complex subunit RsxC [Gammaproteobacteria bacterium]MCP4831528.1 electron transport complex subunit RsxC [Gammaproteobacteria bacterium]MCP4927751.1 electron transport complex subunit RsxC [Gammaproteobacteria bacterium]
MSKLQPLWGINFSRPAIESGGLPLITAPLPDQLVVPLNQNIGFAARALVTEGEQVLKGQPIGAITENKLSAQVHAPTSGTVTRLSVQPVPGQDPALCIEIRADGGDHAWPKYTQHKDPLKLSPTQLHEAVSEAGIVGLGGAMFPTGAKLNPKDGVNTLILNGAECEPRISCDDSLMQDSAATILLGAQVMLRILAADKCVIAVKEHTPAAKPMAHAIQQLNDKRFSLVFVPALYPAGGERQLIELLTNTEVPTGGLPKDIGVVCQNVATAYAIATFLSQGEPLISRIITVSGGGIKQPANIMARIGTPISKLIECAGGYTNTASRLIMGGPMMGIALANDKLPVTKACNSFYIADTTELSTTTELPCIRCGDCATVCPAHLMPQLLLQTKRTNDYSQLATLGLPDCMECGCCDYVCPSNIPLTLEFISAKKTLRDIAFGKNRASHAEQRFNARNERLEKQSEQRERQLNQQIEALETPDTSTQNALKELLLRTEKNKHKDQKK